MEGVVLDSAYSVDVAVDDAAKGLIGLGEVISRKRG
jgi:hypothetical protein